MLIKPFQNDDDVHVNVAHTSKKNLLLFIYMIKIVLKIVFY